MTRKPQKPESKPRIVLPQSRIQKNLRTVEMHASHEAQIILENLRCNLCKDIAKSSARERDAHMQNDFLPHQREAKYLSPLCVKVIAQDE